MIFTGALKLAPRNDNTPAFGFVDLIAVFSQHGTLRQANFQKSGSLKKTEIDHNVYHNNRK